MSTTLPGPHRKLKTHIFKVPERLEAYRLFYEAGVIHALRDALHLCMELGNETTCDHVPAWVVAGSLQTVNDRIKDGRSIGIGQQGNERTVFQTNQRHLLRFMEVMKARVAGATVEEAYQRAADALSESGQAVSVDAIRKSYKRLNKALKNTDEAQKYYPFPHRDLP